MLLNDIDHKFADSGYLTNLIKYMSISPFLHYITYAIFWHSLKFFKNVNNFTFSKLISNVYTVYHNVMMPKLVAFNIINFIFYFSLFV